MLAAESAGADQVYQLNFQFFPLVKPRRAAPAKEKALAAEGKA